MPNVELLEKVWRHIEDHPESHYQQIWMNTCGTAGCFAGWACALAEGVVNDFQKPSWTTLLDGKWLHVEDAATKLLGITNEEGEIMFAGTNTREQLGLMVKDLIDGNDITEIDY